MLFPVFPGRKARFPGKKLCKIFTVRRAYGPGDLIKLLLGSCQQFFGLLQPQLCQTLVDGFSAAFFIQGAQKDWCGIAYFGSGFAQDVIS